MTIARIANKAYQRFSGVARSYASERNKLFELQNHSLVNGNAAVLRKNSVLGNNLSSISSFRALAGMNFGRREFRTTPKHQFANAQATKVESKSDCEGEIYATLEATKPGEKPRIVVLGTGWAACRFLKGIDTKLYDVVCISPRNHMVFTPLLASTCVGTLEFRSVAEPVNQIQTALAKDPNSYYFLASCTGIDTDKHEVFCETAGEASQKPYRFRVAYDKLVIASGAEPLTFNIKGVKEHASFLREVSHAQEIRKKLLLNLMLSENPGMCEEEKERLLHCVVIGGGPTGVEFSGELSDFIMRDVWERYAHVKNYIRVTLIEANEILSSFDVGLRQYATKHLTKSGVRLVRGVVKEVLPDKIILSDGSEVAYGLLVWSTGVGPSEFVKSLNLPKSPGGRIGIDEWLRVPSVQDVYALGDCAGFLESVGKPVLPALAQVAEREGKFLLEMFNRMAREGGGKALSGQDIPLGDPFVYKHFGSMASVGRYKALVDLRESKEDSSGISMAGFISWFVWRSAYLTRVISWRNRFYVAVNWATTLVFGRDNTRIS
ncbi:internal alternative NAD(P)H-ubiquinone oxidoreductase A1, mitochondrial-like [Andrographis paniculata]|uniref:internal alternative NAD(P)H-ubiquinone oxidoreductase A1, mitochondrial-like n=1 Tax=Andrographis paniculata TaxID=175694 RepID=UPI0021E95A9D|nr:internal alternative NAD(P)H-ubiquinone oxidoreductase A1, mitochondrial-like [Andrographis paniculata]XP_051125375.1 internal alternative NAD(P)H-ubiquinone oxidoreductase A1, mitochondrial-like [Andrographis paniculata]XP_051125376.1 internal alternative NAD(P)H-ubiquinone oxidoreductase A1, mitochondrial-like [Andrographis paniculata]XP_051125377.1 internal alternative NAD(P)H-ubiquinone oxidoreductase A1, mitochondrial-like [Andrographis paniculata]XP_051125378.1 internal alternative NAD